MTARRQRLKGPKRAKKRWSVPSKQKQEAKAPDDQEDPDDQEQEPEVSPGIGHNQPPLDQRETKRLETKKRGDYGRERGRYGLSIPEAGGMIGLSRSASYQAARAGQIPVIEIGGLRIVPRIPWLKRLGIETEAAE